MVSLLLLTGCDVAAPASTMRPDVSSATAAPPTASQSPSIVPIAVPRAALGELARSVARPDSITSTRSARARGGQEYLVRGECRSVRHGDSYVYTVKVDGADSSSGQVPCDGSVLVNSVGPIKARAKVAITLIPSPGENNGTAYVVVVPDQH